MCIRDRSNTHHHSSGSKGGTTSIGYGNSEGNSFVDISGKDSMKDSHAAVLPKTEFVVEQLDHVIKINVHTGYDSSKNETKHRSKSNGRANGLISATTPSSQTHIPVEQGPARRRGVGAHGVAIDAKKHNQTNQSNNDCAQREENITYLNQWRLSVSSSSLSMCLIILHQRYIQMQSLSFSQKIVFIYFVQVHAFASSLICILFVY
eukprot:TRINITY_DN5733_c0_g1_i10.p1 TRINITY_DN5733_c0_g1~~TRINITY_DN5733_c0_g1_i10.p1  ORF type:complete len:233 (-),score=19.85 TRINITY_DN5733_c0_g1_i10:83-700(-)